VKVLSISRAGHDHDQPQRTAAAAGDRAAAGQRSREEGQATKGGEEALVGSRTQDLVRRKR